ncbi:hypothetical protein [Bacillus horti]|uniref:PepSY domain-containing protein n=1 Tax=Caldalkalibacillus horti TaxID=77523 RepID=A0ABT9W542_9BACI|nr:hypothetical protein [Bacillus horti]MDQ0168373.1 hypothetical protein [Bacillus horti]
MILFIFLKLEKKEFSVLITALLTVALMVIQTYYLNPLQIPRIDAQNAEAIALNQALEDGFPSPVLWHMDETQTLYLHKNEQGENKRTKVWRVSLDTENNTPYTDWSPAVIYYINAFTGEIMRVNRIIEERETN